MRVVSSVGSEASNAIVGGLGASSYAGWAKLGAAGGDKKSTARHQNIVSKKNLKSVI
eukprot:CAMPEP_0185572608 /NCGR_PEP_ID=MMETSP0434-20130131/4506_1 /TAXON_ID=626734 ORGANISM="Favella taraikaensis, Strain Fe Narragansett Bay" /NCGR_SAMPLE_ID=MMETSP0434 /ASSEMBLY_ACC=CAM_ASM_000379 /LENGTH=56 /DNA_ID=CAMNT_0028188553 /DNA_START=124 /DNA_END=294 /DNA_ORIENTATION=+